MAGFTGLVHGGPRGAGEFGTTEGHGEDGGRNQKEGITARIAATPPRGLRQDAKDAKFEKGVQTAEMRWGPELLMSLSNLVPILLASSAP